MENPLICPICKQALRHESRSLRCLNAHTFDIARQGYVNLLAAQKGGDARPMLKARRRFLARGHYAPLREVIETLARAEGAPLVLEAGCGEGYYVGTLSERMAGRFFGVDVAKDAARMAAGRYKGATFLVADVNALIPLADDAVDVLLNIFAPRNPAEFGRVLAPGGLLIVAIPAPDHLNGLREALGLLDIEEDKREKIIERFASFTLENVREIAYDVRLDGEALADLVGMTPNYRHMRADEIAALRNAPERTVRAAFEVLALRQ